MLYIPELGINILSTNRLKGISIFFKNSIYIYIYIYNNKKLIIKGYKDTLYKTNTNISYLKKIFNIKY